MIYTGVQRFQIFDSNGCDNSCPLAADKFMNVVGNECLEVAPGEHFTESIPPYVLSAVMNALPLLETPESGIVSAWSKS